MAERGATVAHCPVVYARRNRILGSFARYRELGINVGLGTDTFPQDMIEEMRWAALGCKWIDRDANRGTARDVFNAATLGGARALGRSDIGRLAPGAKADIIIVDLHRLHSGPVDDPIKTLVYAACGQRRRDGDRRWAHRAGGGQGARCGRGRAASGRGCRSSLATGAVRGAESHAASRPACFSPPAIRSVCEVAAMNTPAGR